MLFWDLLRVSNSHPVNVGAESNTIVHFLPSLLIKTEINGPTSIAPTGNSGPIHPARSIVTSEMSQETLPCASSEPFPHKSWFILGSTGDVHANALPTLNDPNVTMKLRNILIWIRFIGFNIMEFYNVKEQITSQFIRRVANLPIIAAKHCLVIEDELLLLLLLLSESLL